MPQKLVKDRAIADMLAKNPLETSQEISLNDRILSVEEDTLIVSFDGAVNSSGSSTGAFLISPEGQHYLVVAKLVFPCTNNIAEYGTCILGLQAAIDMEVSKLKVSMLPH